MEPKSVDIDRDVEESNGVAGKLSPYCFDSMNKLKFYKRSKFLLV